MDKNIIEGKAKKVIGATKQKAGELLKDREMQVKGAAKRVEGELQEGFGKAKDEFRKQSH